MINPIALLIGWILDVVFGDPVRLPHPVVWFGRMIAFGEKRLNSGGHRKLKGGLMAVALIALVFGIYRFLLLGRNHSYKRGARCVSCFGSFFRSG